MPTGTGYSDEPLVVVGGGERSEADMEMLDEWRLFQELEPVAESDVRTGFVAGSKKGEVEVCEGVHFDPT